jgi:hypothetical protein
MLGFIEQTSPPGQTPLSGEACHTLAVSRPATGDENCTAGLDPHDLHLTDAGNGMVGRGCRRGKCAVSMTRWEGAMDWGPAKPWERACSFGPLISKPKEKQEYASVVVEMQLMRSDRGSFGSISAIREQSLV